MRDFRLLLFVPAILVIASILYSCKDGFEDYSSSPNDKLSFSTDTIAFDTIISTVNTPFKIFKVYNRNSKDLLISSIALGNGEASEFKINVDGRGGYSFNNIEIRAKDSLFVFVDAKPVENGQNSPQHIQEEILFLTNGNSQKIIVEASSQDTHIWNSVSINSDITLTNEKPYLIYDSLVIEKNAQLTIPEGTIFYMHGKAEIIVKGRINAKGTLEKPIIIRGDRFDQMVNIPYDLIPGQWGGIRFDSDSYHNTFEYVYMRNGSFGMDFEPSDPSTSKITLKNSKITNFKGFLINSVNCNIEAENCEFSNSLKALLNLVGGTYTFTHCTIANHYFSSNEYGWGNSNNETIILKNRYPEDNVENVPSNDYAINQANFYNCVVWGLKDKSSSGISINESDGYSISYYFENCLIPNGTNDHPEAPDASVINCVIGEDPEFKTLLIGEDGKADFIYDFRLTEDSPARNVANRIISQVIPFDLNGIDRFSDDAPDIGAYEWHKGPE